MRDNFYVPVVALCLFHKTSPCIHDPENIKMRSIRHVLANQQIDIVLLSFAHLSLTFFSLRVPFLMVHKIRYWLCKTKF